MSDRKSGRNSLYGDFNDVGGVIYMNMQYDVDYMHPNYIYNYILIHYSSSGTCEAQKEGRWM